MHRFLSMALILMLSLIAPVFAAEAPDPLADVLGQVGLSRATANIDDDTMSFWGGDRFVLNHYRVLHSDPWKIPGYTEVLKSQLDTAGTSLRAHLANLSSPAGAKVRRAEFDFAQPLAEVFKKADESATPLFDALMYLAEATGDKPGLKRAEDWEEKARQVPLEVQRAAAYIVYAAAEARTLRDRAFENVDPLLAEELLQYLTDPLLADESEDAKRQAEMEKRGDQTFDMIDDIDFQSLYAGSMDIATAVDKAVAALDGYSFEGRCDYSMYTPMGWIRIDGRGDTTYMEERDFLLIIDMVGNDTYPVGGGTTGLTTPVSVTIDLTGNDTYGDEEAAQAFGYGRFGWGFNIDIKGNDRYIAANSAFGCGVFGVGALLDLAGDDEYRVGAFGEGAGFAGIGLMIDNVGTDRYWAENFAQGFGWIRGLGALIDTAGRDRYELDDTPTSIEMSDGKEFRVMRHASPQTDQHNVSMGQGVGYGFRRDYIDGKSLAGGFGLLYDAKGDDWYGSGLHAQGYAYWYGVGMLLEGEGNDSYEGVWYNQGSTAHFGLGVLRDFSGNDSYKVAMNMGIGAGHDFGVGMFIEDMGNDTYSAPNLALGGGNANGMGIFVDVMGNDNYTASAALTFGRSKGGARGSLRDLAPSFGIFMDLKGADTYPEEKAFAGNNTMWIQPAPGDDPLEVEYGVGLDGEFDGWKAPRW